MIRNLDHLLQSGQFSSAESAIQYAEKVAPSEQLSSAHWYRRFALERKLRPEGQSKTDKSLAIRYAGRLLELDTQSSFSQSALTYWCPRMDRTTERGRICRDFDRQSSSDKISRSQAKPLEARIDNTQIKQVEADLISELPQLDFTITSERRTLVDLKLIYESLE